MLLEHIILIKFHVVKGDNVWFQVNERRIVVLLLRPIYLHRANFPELLSLCGPELGSSTGEN